MDHSGMDVHKRASQICLPTEAGELIDRRVRTEPTASRRCSAIGQGRGS